MVLDLGLVIIGAVIVTAGPTVMWFCGWISILWKLLKCLFATITYPCRCLLLNHSVVTDIEEEASFV